MEYRGFKIEKDPHSGWKYVHKEYDGPEDTRIGTASSFVEARCQIDEMIEGLESGELKGAREMEAWSGGIADNH